MRRDSFFHSSKHLLFSGQRCEHGLPDTAARQSLWRWTRTWCEGCLGSARSQRCWSSYVETKTQTTIGDYKTTKITDKTWKMYFFVTLLKLFWIMYPKATAAATASPMAADLPRPLAAVRATVLLRVFSEIASINFSTALAWKLSKCQLDYIIYLNHPHNTRSKRWIYTVWLITER